MSGETEILVLSKSAQHIMRPSQQHGRV